MDLWIPKEIEKPSSFEVFDHIAVINLKENILPYKIEIAKAIIKTNPHIKSVFNKT